MDNPLTELDGWWLDASEDGGEGEALALYEHRYLGGDDDEETHRLEFRSYDDADAQAHWRLDIRDCLEFRWDDSRGEPAWFDSHVLLAPYDREGALISFAKPFNDPIRAWGALAKTHRALVGSWYPLERFVRTDLLESRFGQLSSGPARLLGAYAETLRSLSEEFGYAPQDWSWRAQGPTPSALTWGKSYFVDRSFRLTRLS